MDFPMLFTIRLVLKPLSVCVRVLPLIQRYTHTRTCVCGCVGAIILNLKHSESDVHCRHTQRLDCAPVSPGRIANVSALAPPRPHRAMHACIYSSVCANVSGG